MAVRAAAAAFRPFLDAISHRDNTSACQPTVAEAPMVPAWWLKHVWNG